MNVLCEQYPPKRGPLVSNRRIPPYLLARFDSRSAVVNLIPYSWVTRLGRQNLVIELGEAYSFVRQK